MLSCEFWEIFKNIYFQTTASAGLWRLLLDFLSVKCQAFTIKGTDNSLTMKELCHIFPWKFLNIKIGLFFRIPLSCCFWKYPSRQKHVRSWQQRNASEMLFGCLYNYLRKYFWSLRWSLIFANIQFFIYVAVKESVAESGLSKASGLYCKWQ